MSQPNATRRLAQDPAKLYRLRVRSGMSQRGLAAAAGTTSATVCRLERGLHSATPKILKQLAHALDVDVEELMPDEAVAG